MFVDLLWRIAEICGDRHFPLVTWRILTCHVAGAERGLGMESPWACESSHLHTNRHLVIILVLLLLLLILVVLVVVVVHVASIVVTYCVVLLSQYSDIVWL